MTESTRAAVLSLLETDLTDSDRATIMEKIGLGPKNHLLTRKEVAKDLGISLPTLRLYEKAGLLKVIKYSSRKHRFRASDVAIFKTLGVAAIQQK